jgi:hypothetical protein
MLAVTNLARDEAAEEGRVGREGGHVAGVRVHIDGVQILVASEIPVPQRRERNRPPGQEHVRNPWCLRRSTPTRVIRLHAAAARQLQPPGCIHLRRFPQQLLVTHVVPCH